MEPAGSDECQPFSTTDTEYEYVPAVVRATGEPNLRWDVFGGPKGMRVSLDTGRILWTPSPEQIGTRNFQLVVVDEYGNAVYQYWNVEVVERASAPRITSDPVTGATLGGVYVYDVQAADLGEREQLTYLLRADLTSHRIPKPTSYEMTAMAAL